MRFLPLLLLIYSGMLAQNFSEFHFGEASTSETLGDATIDSNGNILFVANVPRDDQYGMTIINMDATSEVLNEWEIELEGTHYGKKILELEDGFAIYGYQWDWELNNGFPFLTRVLANGTVVWTSYSDDLNIVSVTSSGFHMDALALEDGSFLTAVHSFYVDGSQTSFLTKHSASGEIELVQPFLEFEDFEISQLLRLTNGQTVACGFDREESSLNGNPTVLQNGTRLLSINSTGTYEELAFLLDEQEDVAQSTFLGGYVQELENGELIVGSVSNNFVSPPRVMFHHLDDDGTVLDFFHQELPNSYFPQIISSGRSNAKVTFLVHSNFDSSDLHYVDLDLDTGNTNSYSVALDGYEADGHILTLSSENFVLTSHSQLEGNTGSDIVLLHLSNENYEQVATYGSPGPASMEWAFDLVEINGNLFIGGSSSSHGQDGIKPHILKTDLNGNFIDRWDFLEDNLQIIHELSVNGNNEIVCLGSTATATRFYMVLNPNSGEVLSYEEYDFRGSELNALVYDRENENAYFTCDPWVTSLGIAKTSSNGELEWTIENGEFDDSKNFDITLQSDGNLIVAHSSRNSPQFNRQLHLSKLSPEGDFIWTHTQTDPEDFNLQLLKAIETSDGEIAAIGSRDNSTFSSDAGIVLMRLNQDGELLWQKNFEISGREGENYDLDEDNDGNLYLLTHFTPGPLLNGLRVINLVKVDAQGEVLESWSLGTENGYGPLAYNSIWTTDGSLAITGRVSRAGTYDILLVKVAGLPAAPQVGIESAEMYAFKTAPNPVTRNSRIELIGIMDGDYDYQLVSSNGVVSMKGKISVIGGQTNHIELPKHETGIYYLELIGQDRKYQSAIRIF